MNPILLSGLWTFRREMLAVSGIVTGVLLLPILVVISLVGSGVPGASSAIAQSQPTTGSVTLVSPNGDRSANYTASRQWPTHGTVTLEFGQSDAPYQVHHTGIDIASSVGTQVVAFSVGTVRQVGYSMSQGNFIVIDHGQGVSSRYLHFSIVTVKSGQQVEEGIQIGRMGTTGFSTGPHLHFEIRVNEIPVNPRTFLEGNP